MDILTLAGVIIGFAAVIGGNYLEGGQLGQLINLPAALIVVGGTVGAAVLQTSRDGLRYARLRSRWIVLPPQHDHRQLVQKILRWAHTARKEGLLGLESVADREPDLFARKGLQLLVDGSEPEAIRNVMETESALYEQQDLDAARFYESMGGYAPTIGIIGAVMGLIQVMGNLADPGKLGSGIAVAFVATIYGVALANLLLIPLAGKLKQCARSEYQFRELVIEGVIAIAEGENPRSIELKLNSYIPR